MAPVAGFLGLTSVRPCETIFDGLGSEDEHALSKVDWGGGKGLGRTDYGRLASVKST